MLPKKIYQKEICQKEIQRKNFFQRKKFFQHKKVFDKIRFSAKEILPQKMLKKNLLNKK